MATVIVVDGEPVVREIVAAILSNEGFDVLQAGGLREAEQLCREHEGAVDLAIVDDALNDGQAPEVVNRLARSHPETRVLRFSGFPREFLLQEGTLGENEPFLEKPFHRQELLNQVRRVLGYLPASKASDPKHRRAGGGGT